MDQIIKTGQLYQHHKGKYYLALYQTEPLTEDMPDEAIHVGHAIHTNPDDLRIVSLYAWGDKIWAMAGDMDQNGKLTQIDSGIVYTKRFGEFWFRPAEDWLRPTDDGKARFVPVASC
jgi:hypothetical protein